MKQLEFFETFQTKKMKEVTIRLECECEILYSPITEEVLAKLCALHENIQED